MSELVRADGCRLHFETFGDAEYEAIVLLEGMGGDIPGWRRNIPHLADELFVIAFDFRGNGRSDAPDEEQSMATFAEDTLAVLDAVGVRSAHAYGQSFGGMVAQEIALDHPARVLSLVLAATHFGGPHVVRSKVRVPKDRPFLALYSERFAAEHPDHVREDLVMGARSRQRPHAARRQARAVESWSSYERLPDITAPTLVLHGTEDRMVPVENARVLAQRIPGAELVLLEAAGHVYHSEMAAEADAAVLDFIRRRGRG
jgi:pimeloyl-ACP methyl ester carboxylesterase